jgi:hypothetical protein
MPREGTRSQTGNSKPRVFPVIDTAPASSRKKTTKPKKKVADVAKAKKPTGVTKKKAPAKKEPGVVKKVKAAVKKVEKKAEIKTDEAKAKPAKKEKPLVK